jgi:putative membrane protein
VKEFFKRWVVTTVAVLVAEFVVPGIRYDNWVGLVVATLVLGLLNASLRPLLMLLSLPLVIFTLGLFILIINAGLLYLVGQMKHFHVDTFGAAFWGALIISVVSVILNSLTGSGSTRIRVQRRGTARRRSSRNPDDDNGPVIDV